jgi:protease-4
MHVRRRVLRSAVLALRVALCTACVSVAVAGRATAQLPRATGPSAVPPLVLAAPDDALAVDANPAALAFLGTWSLVYAGALAPGNASLAEGGHALYAATPLAFGLSAGVGAWSRDLPGAGTLGGASLALAWAPDAHWGFGADARLLTQTGRADAPLDGALTLDLAATWRPAPTLAVSLLGRDLTAPGGTLGAPGAVPRSLALAVALRPFGSEALTLDLAAGLDAEARVGLRAAASLRVPAVGELLASVEASEPGSAREALRVSAGLRVQWDRAAVTGGVLLDPADARAPGAFWSARLEGAPRTGLPRPRAVLELPLRMGSERQAIALVLQLDRARHDARIAGVLLRGGSAPVPTAYAQELREQIVALREAGKPVVCHLEAASGGELYACAGANRTLLDPAGGVRLVGPSSDVLLLGDALREAGVRADFVRIGRFKSAVEQLQNARSSDAAREEREALLDAIYGRFADELGRDLGLDAARARGLVDGGPYLAEEAVAAGLVDATADAHELDDVMAEVIGARLPRQPRIEADAVRLWGVGGRVGLVVLDGDLVDGDNVDVPLVGVHLTGGTTAVRAIDALAGDPTVRAIVVRVDTPGGSALASDRIWRAITRARARKPVVCSMGAVAASGGYFAASAADEIWADAATVTGSIGIFFGKVDVAPLAARFGVAIESTGRGRHAGAESVYRPFTPEERALLAQKIRVLYRQFLARVSEGRTASGHAMSRTRVDALGRGRVWSGDVALREGLVDRLGGLGAALARARTLGGLDVESSVVIVPRRPTSLLDYVLGEALAPSARARASEAALRVTGLPALDADALADEALPHGEAGDSTALAMPSALRALLGAVVALEQVQAGGAVARLPYSLRVE